MLHKTMPYCREKECGQAVQPEDGGHGGVEAGISAVGFLLPNLKRVAICTAI